MKKLPYESTYRGYVNDREDYKRKPMFLTSWNHFQRKSPMNNKTFRIIKIFRDTGIKSNEINW